MTWIKTIPISEAGDELLSALEAQRALYPAEYGEPVHGKPPKILSLARQSTRAWGAGEHCLSQEVVAFCRSLCCARETAPCGGKAMTRIQCPI